MSNARPEPFVADDVALLIRDYMVVGSYLKLLGAFLKLLECRGQLGKKVLHANAIVLGILNLGVSRMKL